MQEEKKENNQKNENKKIKKCYCSSITKKIIAIIFFAALILCLGICLRKWERTKELKLSLGLASPNFPYRDYTVEELNKMYPQVRNADVPTRATPEETYAKLKEALKAKDVDMAAECFIEKKREEWRTNFKQVKEEGNMNNLAEELSEELTKNYMYDTTASYSIPQKIDGEIFDHIISFTKNASGDWKLDSL